MKYAEHEPFALIAGLEQRINLLTEIVRELSASRIVAVPRIDILDYDSPTESMVVVDKNDDELAWWARGEWHKGGQLKPAHVFHHVSTGDSGDFVNIIAVPGIVYGWNYHSNDDDNSAAIKLVNSASTPSPTSPRMTPVNPDLSASGHLAFSRGIEFSAGIGLCITRGFTDGDNTNVAADEIVVDIYYLAQTED